MNLKMVKVFFRHGTSVTNSMFWKASIIVDDQAAGQSTNLLSCMELCLGGDSDTTIRGGVAERLDLLFSLTPRLVLLNAHVVSTSRHLCVPPCSCMQHPCGSITRIRCSTNLPSVCTPTSNSTQAHVQGIESKDFVTAEELFVGEGATVSEREWDRKSLVDLPMFLVSSVIPF